MKLRQPAVAGQFYPDDANEIRSLFYGWFTAMDGAESPPDALIVPHAGFVYSGKVAAFGYAKIREHHSRIRRVILLGPSHRCYLEGCAIPTAHAFVTPFGQVPLDRAACETPAFSESGRRAG